MPGSILFGAVGFLALCSSLVTVDAASPYHLKARYGIDNATSIVPTGSMRSTGLVSTTVAATVTSSAPNNSTATAIRPTQTSAFEHSGFNLTMNPMFNATGNWTTLSCTDPMFSSINPAGSTLWEYAGADQALTQLLAAWDEADRASTFQDYTFSRFVWTMFNVTGGRNVGPPANCADPYDSVCSTPIECENIPPAGYLIINSMVMMHQIYQMQHNAINDAYNTLNGAMQLVVDNFDWQPAPDKTTALIEEILGFVTVALGAVSGGTIAEAFTAIRIFGTVTEETANTLKTVASTGVGLTNNILKDMPAPATQGDILGDLNAILDAGYAGLTQGVSGMLETLTEANSKDNQTLFQDFMNTGLLLDYGNQNTNNTQNLTNKAVSMMYGQMIPAAWALSVRGLRPFILRIDAKDMKCNGTLPKSSNGLDVGSLFDKNVAQDALWCDDDGNSFWLLNGVQQEACASEFGCASNGAAFQLLPGGNNTNLNGQNWGGITLGDIIRSSWGGFMANNKQNDYNIPQGSSEQVASNMTLQGSDGLPMSGGILTPGFFNFTICLDYNEAYKTLTGNDKTAPICATSPGPGDSTTGMNNPGSYTPGWCKVHVDQYQRNEGNENPLNNYQLSVDIYDGASLLIGDATKQSAAEPLAIVDSVLPAELIVAPGAGDNDPIEFWYADQYWLSNSTQNQCSVGGYSSGMRQMTCGFSCPLPAAQPPVSATVAHKLPTAPTDAIAGTKTFVNTYITAAPTPTATQTSGGATPAKPTPTYATGQCGVHVTQYQKHDGSNPTGNYEIDVTIYDAKHNAIGNSGQVGAPQGQAVPVSGLVSPFTVTAGAVDNDPLTFSFAGVTFNSSSRCSVGKYDSGTRNMDCGFAC